VRGKRRWIFVESTEFQKASKTHLSDVELDAVKELIPRHPAKWIALKGGPGLFALHWGAKTQITIVFIVSPEARKVYLVDIEPGRHYTVVEEVKKALPSLRKKLERLGTRIATWYGLREAVKWIIENLPWP
jgi:hypothetical protein